MSQGKKDFFLINIYISVFDTIPICFCSAALWHVTDVEACSVLKPLHLTSSENGRCMNLWFSEIKITVCKKQILRLEFISLPSCQFSHKRALADKATGCTSHALCWECTLSLSPVIDTRLMKLLVTPHCRYLIHDVYSLEYYNQNSIYCTLQFSFSGTFIRWTSLFLSDW